MSCQNSICVKVSLKTSSRAEFLNRVEFITINFLEIDKLC